MLFVVCLSCFKVFTHEEGHRCSDNEENKSNSENILLIRAKPANLMQNYSDVTRNENIHGDIYRTNQRFRSMSRFVRRDFNFSVVSPVSGHNMTDVDCRYTSMNDGAINLKISKTLFDHQHQSQNVSQNLFVNQDPSIDNSENSGQHQKECIPPSARNLPPSMFISKAEYEKQIVFPVEISRDQNQMQLHTEMCAGKNETAESLQSNQIQNVRNYIFVNQDTYFESNHRFPFDGYSSANIRMSENLDLRPPVIATSRDTIETDNKCRKDICTKAEKRHYFVGDKNAAKNNMASDESHSVDNRHKSPIFSGNQSKNMYLRNSPKKKATVEISDSEVSIVDGVNSKDSIVSTPGPSGFRENEVLLQLSSDNRHSSTLSDKDSLLLKYQKTFICWVCKKKSDEHSKKDGKTERYICCVCEYKALTRYDLEIHSRIHCAKINCDICLKDYTERDSHKSGQLCTVCNETFGCETRLHQHFVKHEKHFETHCWGCSIALIKHSIKKENKTFYFCCICKYEHRDCYNLKYHNGTHRSVTCKSCKEKYPKDREEEHSKEYKCIVCKEKFECINLLADHSINHEKHFDTHCRVCNKETDDHKMKEEENHLYKCCQCPETFCYENRLQRHLYSHTGQKMFKCDVCEKRYSHARNFQNHLKKKCVLLPSKCEICRAKFPSSSSLYAHSLEQHRHT